MRSFAIVVVLAAGLAGASTATAADLELGKKVFADKCASCHGADGKGNAKMEEKLKAKISDLSAGISKSDAEILQLLSEGKKPMPSFKKLSKKELQAVGDYAKSLAKGGK
jgi:mono/diheme cytochrome c family protein